TRGSCQCEACGRSAGRARTHVVAGAARPWGSARPSELLLGYGDGEPLAPLATTTRQRELPAAGLHALAEAVGALAALVMGLVGALHGLFSWFERRANSWARLKMFGR